jgi:RNA polymerase sigma-70 factor (ECF subfamily)
MYLPKCLLFDSNLNINQFILFKHITYQEKELLLRLENGDQLALAQLMEIYKNNIYTTAIHIIKSTEIAEEVVQDVFMIIWKKRKELKEIENFPAYLHGIAKHTIYHALKNVIQQRERKLKGEKEEMLLFHQDIEEWLYGREFELILQKAIERLPARQKQAFNLIKLEGCTREEAAEQLQISSETVKSNLEEAIRKIRAYCLCYQKILIWLILYAIKNIF